VYKVTRILYTYILKKYVVLYKKVKQSLYRPGVAQRAPES